MKNGEFNQTSNQKCARPRARYACFGCRKSKRRCDGIPNQRECSECRGKKRACNFSVCPNCLNKNEKNINCICDNCLSKSKQQDFDNFQMGNITAPSLVNDTYEDEIYNGVNGYEDGIPYDVIFTYDASPNSYIGLPQFYADVGQQTYRNDFLDQYEIHEINFTSYSFPQVYRCDIFGPCETEYPQWYFYGINHN
ncbi:hypothetical protein F8M41_019949 [Gigaspora margarita]|uniref:Zn(2)-C6 fungal-type domain-containing protein n=1 Tax=Gigaspora margarita TaxID=4874 RepID=A0A8H4AJ63_GIGMA|nr:hypothetical protein F8M41_019949 [Gigaspora margarita]